MPEEQEPLFEQIGEDDYRCTNCDARTTDYPNLIEAEEFPSYGGTTEGYERCTFCGKTQSWIDLSAVI